METTNTRRFGSGREAYAIPDLTEIQTKSYARFLQYDTPLDKRKSEGLEGVLKEIFPIESYDKKLSLSYLRYELGKPRYEPDECRQLRLTYGRPFRIWLRLNKEQPIEEEVYLGDLPIMIMYYYMMACLEGFAPAAGWIDQSGPEEVIVDEVGVRLAVRPGSGHKTGFYLDQADNRVRVTRDVGPGATLDVFAYTGAFACHALRAGAARAVCVESSPGAGAAARRNFELNG